MTLLQVPTLIWWMRLRPSFFMVSCRFSSMLTRGLGWGLGPGWGGSLLVGGVCLGKWETESTPESLHTRLHISQAEEGLVLTKVQNRHIHYGAGRRCQTQSNQMEVTSRGQR